MSSRHQRYRRAARIAAASQRAVSASDDAVLQSLGEAFKQMKAAKATLSAASKKLQNPDAARYVKLSNAFLETALADLNDASRILLKQK